MDHKNGQEDETAARSAAPGWRIGQGMAFAAWILVLGILTYFFAGYLRHRENPNQDLVGMIDPEGVPTVVLQSNEGRQYVATGRINGQTVDFLLDTGATEVALPIGIARELGLTMIGPPQSVVTAAGPSISYETRLDAVELGPIRLTNILAGVSPEFHGHTVLLGMSFLKHLEFTQRDGRLILRQLRGHDRPSR